MLRTFCRRCDKRKVDVCRRRGRELFLRLLRCLLQSLHRHLVAGEIDALLLLELVDHPLDQFVVKIITTEVRIAVCRENLDDAIADLDDGHIKCTAAEVIHQNLLLFLVVKAICQRCRCRLVDDTLYIQSCDLTCILCRLTLRIIEVCRNCDDCL